MSRTPTIKRGYTSSVSAYLFFECFDKKPGDVEARLILDLAEAGRAGDVHFGQPVADHVEADEQQASFRDRGPDRRGDLAMARADRLRHAARPGRQVAARFVGLRDAREAVRHRLA